MCRCAASFLPLVILIQSSRPTPLRLFHPHPSRLRNLCARTAPYNQYRLQRLVITKPTTADIGHHKKPLQSPPPLSKSHSSMSLALDDASALQARLPTWENVVHVVYPDYGDTQAAISACSHTPPYVIVPKAKDEDDDHSVDHDDSSNPASGSSILQALDSENGSSRRSGFPTKSLGVGSNSTRPRRSQNSGSSPSSGGIPKDKGSGDAASDLIQQFQEVYVAGHATGYEKGYQARSDDQSLSELLVKSAVGSLPTFFYYTALPPILGMAASLASSTVNSCLGSVASSLLSSK